MNITDLLANGTQLVSLLIIAIGILAFVVSVITQVIKGVGVFAKIPTNGLVMALSVVITMIAFVAIIQYMNYTLVWYMIVAAIIIGFFVAFVAMFGWEKFTDLWKRYYKKSE